MRMSFCGLLCKEKAGEQDRTDYGLAESPRCAAEKGTGRDGKPAWRRTAKANGKDGAAWI